MAQRTCSVDGCVKTHKARGFCMGHYRRMQRHGDPGEAVPLGEIDRNGTGKNYAWLKAAVATAAPDRGCIEWPFARDPNGYGCLTVGKRQVRAHRMALVLATDEDPKGMYAAHAPGICHNPTCVNPHHLRWATNAENVMDRKLDGDPLIKLDADSVRAIRRLSEAGMEQKDIAARHGVTQGAVSHIVTGKRWAHVK